MNRNIGNMDDKTLNDLVAKYPCVTYADDEKGYTVITCVARLGFVNFKEAKKGKYSCAIILPASADVSPLMAAAKKCWAEGKVAAVRKTPKITPLKAQSELADKYAGFGAEGYFINASTKEVPKLFNVDMTPADVTRFKSGDYARVKVRAYEFDKEGNWGVSFGLQAVQFFAEGEALGGGGDAAGGFEAAKLPPGSGTAKMPLNGATW
jgi:hypothetical protein